MSFTLNFVRPLWNSVQGQYYAGQNPFASPLHICRGLSRISEQYSLNQDNCRILREFTAPIVMQLAQTLRENDGVLPRNFAFAKDTIRSLYLYGESGSGKSRLVLEELPKIFLRDPRSAIIVTDSKGFSYEEDVFNALFAKPIFTYGSTGVSIKRQRNVGEKIIANAGRGVVVFDDYTKYSTTALDRAIISLHNEGKINTVQGEIDCPALLLFLCSSETEEEFKLFPEQEAERKIPARRLNEEDDDEIIPEQVKVRRVGHPRGFVRRVRHMHLPRLKSENLRKALSDYFDSKVAPNILRNCRVELGPSALDELIRLNERRGGDLEHAFEMSAIQAAILDFKLSMEKRTQDMDLVVTFSHSKFQVRLKSYENLSETTDTTTDNDLIPDRRLGCFASFNRRYGISSGIRRFGSLVSSFFCCCCCQEAEDFTENNYLLSYRGYRMSSVIMDAPSFETIDPVHTQNVEEKLPGKSQLLNGLSESPISSEEEYSQVHSDDNKKAEEEPLEKNVDAESLEKSSSTCEATLSESELSISTPSSEISSSVTSSQDSSEDSLDESSTLTKPYDNEESTEILLSRETTPSESLTSSE